MSQADSDAARIGGAGVLFLTRSPARLQRAIQNVINDPGPARPIRNQGRTLSFSDIERGLRRLAADILKQQSRRVDSERS